MQLRSDRSVGRVQLRVSNLGASDTRIDAASLSSPVFGGVLEWDKAPATVRAGQTVDLPLFVRAPVCTDDVALTARLTASGRVLDLVPSDPLGAVTGFRDAACRSNRVADTVAISASAVTVTEQTGESVAELTVRLMPTGRGEPVSVAAVRSTVLLVPETGQEWPIELTVSASSVESAVRLSIVPRRCDAHALAEDKVGTLFPVVIRENGEEYTLPLPLDPGVKDDLLRFVGRACGFLS